MPHLVPRCPALCPGSSARTWSHLNTYLTSAPRAFELSVYVSACWTGAYTLVNYDNK